MDMPEKTRTDREFARMKLYCDVYVSLANHSTAGAKVAKDWAKGAVEEFDKVFPAPDNANSLISKGE